jgi:hypothetical protein
MKKIGFKIWDVSLVLLSGVFVRSKSLIVNVLKQKKAVQGAVFSKRA